MIKSMRVLPLLFVLALASCGGSKNTTGNVTISGTLSNSKNDTLYLVDINKSEFKVLDSTITGADGSFEFHSNIAFKGFFNINVGKGSQQFATLILEPGDKISFSGNAKNLGYTWKASGSKEMERWTEFSGFITNLEKVRQPLNERIDSLQRTFQVEVSMVAKGDSAKIDSLDKVFGAIYETTQAQLMDVEKKGADYVRTFIDKDSTSFANIPALRLLEPFDNFAYYEKTIRGLESKHASVPNVKMLRDYIERERPYVKGQTPPEIAMNNPEGKELRLSSLKGKVVLIDFWASWCGPCRAELPNVVKNYNKYHDKGFEVFSVSLDKDKTAWTNAISSEKLSWPYHVSDLMEWQSPVVKLYNFNSIPKTVLLGTDGKIIDRDLRGEALSHTLDSLFGGAASPVAGK